MTATKQSVEQSISKMTNYLIHQVFGQQGIAKTPDGLEKLAQELLRNIANQAYVLGRESK